MGAWYGPVFIANFSATIPSNSISGRQAKFSCRPTRILLRAKTRSWARPASSMRFAPARKARRTAVAVTFTLGELARMSDGELVGDPEQVIKRAASLIEADEGDISFFGDARYLALLRK